MGKRTTVSKHPRTGAEVDDVVTSTQRQIEKLDDINELLMDSGLSFERKMTHSVDSDWSIRKIRKDIISNNFEGAIDKLEGLNARLGIGDKFSSSVENLIEDIADFT